jgi:hypothetical protein
MIFFFPLRPRTCVWARSMVWWWYGSTATTIPEEAPPAPPVLIQKQKDLCVYVICFVFNHSTAHTQIFHRLDLGGLPRESTVPQLQQQQQWEKEATENRKQEGYTVHRPLWYHTVESRFPPTQKFCFVFCVSSLSTLFKLKRKLSSLTHETHARTHTHTHTQRASLSSFRS